VYPAYSLPLLGVEWVKELATPKGLEPFFADASILPEFQTKRSVRFLFDG